jgi:ADP-heptose:LPS heptosyltransferase
VRALRDQYPQAKLTVITWNTNRAILVGNPAVDHLYSVNNTIEAVRLLRQLQKKESIDLAVGLSHGGSALLVFIKAPQKVGFNAQNLGWIYNGEVPDRRNIHAVEYCLEVLAPLGINPPAHSLLEFYYSSHDLQVAASFLESCSGYPLVAIHPGGKFFPVKRWQPAGFAKVADYLMGRLKAKVVLVGGRDDEPLAQEIASLMEHQPLIAAGQTSLKETAAIISRSDLFVGNDSAPQHIASSVGVPVVSLFGPTDPANFHPWGVPHRIVRCELGCSPCFHWLGSPLQYLPTWDNPTCQRECMRSITAQQVIGELENLLEEISGRTGALR